MQRYITTLQEEENYLKYRERLATLSELKEQLSQAVEELGKTRTLYVRYLEANPYKDKKVILEGKVEYLREKIIEMIPQGFY